MVLIIALGWTSDGMEFTKLRCPVVFFEPGSVTIHDVIRVKCGLDSVATTAPAPSDSCRTARGGCNGRHAPPAEARRVGGDRRG